MNDTAISRLVVSPGRFPTNKITGISTYPFSRMEELETGRTVRGHTFSEGMISARKTFRRLPTDIRYLEGELCISVNLEDSR